MRPLYDARVEGLGPGDLVEIECVRALGEADGHDGADGRGAGVRRYRGPQMAAAMQGVR
jgi:hypothetical protein